MPMPEGESRTSNELSQREASSSARVLRTQELFGGSREIWIEHEGKYYRLRITRRNKLILQK
jgi:hemin uptake protein HemP